MATSHQRIIVLLAALLLGVSCKDRYFCLGAPYNNCLFAAGIPCTSSSKCPSDTPVCDVGGRDVCVQCTPAEDKMCSGSTPVCRDNTCQGCIIQAECNSPACLLDGSCGSCTEHRECASLACLPDGSCADPSQVAYVQSGGTGPQPCAKDAPCGTLQEGINAVNKSIPYIKVSNAKGPLTPNVMTTINGKAVIILADPGATLARMGNGVNLVVSNAGADVQIYDLEISGASDVGISIPMGGMPKLALTRVQVTNNMAGGISANSGIVTVSQSTISGNADGIVANNGIVTVSQSTISENSGQGISMDGGTLQVSQSTISSNSMGGISASGTGVTFDITNCFIFRNGGMNADIGGVSLKDALVGTSVFSFNTVVDNGIRDTDLSAGGVLCDIVSFVASNNIIVRNLRNNMSNQPNSNKIGMCQHLTSAVMSGVSALKFVSPDIAPYDYHLKQGSSAIDQATTPSTLAVDIDGDFRPQGNARDQGADEVP